MSHVYVLTNQHQQFLSKSNEWIDGRENTKLFRTEHKDVAINQMFEANTRNVSLRIELLECELDGKRQPTVPESALSDEPLATQGEEPLGESPETQGEPIAASAGDPEELPQTEPSETPPEYNPEVDPQPTPEVEPEPQPEINPDQYPGDTPEIQPDQPPESALTTPQA
ncbi:hypothetical protein [Microbulbifer aggregans]|uniref:hypothetical protein n=1 Tax=Microbulbifer aggregans TaxID=1769779 RepID=UPI001CFF1D21|nr:hypothetical protein [Microbulbifer aggregans]